VPSHTSSPSSTQRQQTLLRQLRRKLRKHLGSLSRAVGRLSADLTESSQPVHREPTKQGRVLLQRLQRLYRLHSIRLAQIAASYTIQCPSTVTTRGAFP
jgi:hypothetical protein